MYHALNRAVARLPLFEKAGDYQAFERVLDEALQEHPTRVLASCLMPNHWHFVLWPERDGELTAFLRWLTHTHTQRWHAHYHTAGTGHLYQGRFKAFPIEQDDHLLTVLRYVERNPLRAGLVPRAEAWRWSSLGQSIGVGATALRLHPWPVPRLRDWVERVNRPETEVELAAFGGTRPTFRRQQLAASDSGSARAGVHAAVARPSQERQHRRSRGRAAAIMIRVPFCPPGGNQQHVYGLHTVAHSRRVLRMVSPSRESRPAL